ncbi:hypothetical protein V6N13_015976 [Hibiscus sabdariffa]
MVVYNSLQLHVRVGREKHLRFAFVDSMARVVTEESSHKQENNVKSESESQSETSSETGKKSSPFEDRCKFSIEEEALNALYVGKDYNDSCGMVREEVGRQIGEIEILGCGLMKTLVKESENQFELHGEDNIEKNPGEVQEATDIVIGLKRADVVSKGLEDTTFIMSGSKDAGLNLGPIFVSSRALEDSRAVSIA